jgi:hypothetical protein
MMPATNIPRTETLFGRDDGKGFCSAGGTRRRCAVAGVTVPISFVDRRSGWPVVSRTASLSRGGSTSPPPSFRQSRHSVKENGGIPAVAVQDVGRRLTPTYLRAKLSNLPFASWPGDGRRGRRKVPLKVGDPHDL